MSSEPRTPSAYPCRPDLHGCRVCEREAMRRGDLRPLEAWFIVCPTCGNKRCPKASAHWQECSGSNDTGQRGSFYGPEDAWPKLEETRG